MLYEIREAIHEIFHWVGGVTACATQGIVAGAVTGAAMGGGLGYVASGPFTDSLVIPGAAAGAALGAAAGGIVCGITRVFDEDAGRKITSAWWGAAVGSVFSLGIPCVAQISALGGACAAWEDMSDQITEENRQAEILMANLKNPHSFLRLYFG